MLTRVKVKNSKTKEESVINCGAAFVAIGHDPNTKFVKGQVDMDANGYISVKPGSTRTSVEGVFAAGDVADHVYRQVRVFLAAFVGRRRQAASKSRQQMVCDSEARRRPAVCRSVCATRSSA